MSRKARQEDISSCLNPEFASWIWQWYKEAQERDQRIQFALRKAFDSMVGHGEKLRNGREASKLSGIGEHISERLEKRLRQHIAEGNRWHCELTIEVESVAEKRAKPARAAPTKPYVPPFRSSNYAIVLAIFREINSGTPFMTKEAVLRAAQEYTDTVLSESLLSSGLKSLVEREIVDRWSTSAKYTLTEAGEELASRLWRAAGKELPNEPPLSQTSQTAASLAAVTISGRESHSVSILEWPAGSYSLEIAVDMREQVGKRGDLDQFIQGLDARNLPVTQRVLELGDIIFLARRGDEEVVLDHVIERKTDADLVASITDGRFKEQKHRLARSSFRRVIYLLEGSGDGPSVASIGADRFFAAITQTPIQEGFFCKRTRNLEETFQFIHDLYLHISESLHDQPLCFVALDPGAEFDRERVTETLSESEQVHLSYALYAAMNSKTANWTFRDIFVQQLMTIKGVTGEKAVQIARKFPSPIELYEEYRLQPSEVARELLFAEWQSDVPGKERKFGPALSRRIYQVFWSLDYPSEAPPQSILAHPDEVNT